MKEGFVQQMSNRKYYALDKKEPVEVWHAVGLGKAIVSAEYLII
ncbi:MAG: hypothetical protein ACI86M_002373 [Saprospiraceae bacterium]